MAEELSSLGSKCLTLVSVRYKHGEDAERIRKRVRKKLSRAFQSQPQQKSAKHVRWFSKLPANDIQQVATSSRYVVVLLKDGRVARFKVTPTHEPGPHSGTAKPRPNPRTSLQVMSDEQYARRLQSMADQEGIESPIYSPPPPYMPPEDSTIYWPHLDSPHPFDINFVDFREPPFVSSALDYPLLPPGAEDDFGPGLPNLWSQFGLSRNEPGNVEEEGQPQYERLDSGVSLDPVDSTEHQRENTVIGSLVVPKNSEENPQPSSSSFPSASSRVPGNSADPIPALIPSILKAVLSPLEALVGERREPAPDLLDREMPNNHSRTGHVGSSGNTVPSPHDAQASSAGSKASRVSSSHSHLPYLGPVEWLTSVEVEGDNLGKAPPFQLVSATHSEALLVTMDTGVLYQWPSDHDSARPYPLTEQLKLVHGGIRLLKSSDIRTTLVLDTGEIATFYDPLLRDSSSPQSPQLIAELSHPAQLFPGLRPPQDKIESLAIGDFLSMAITTSGKTYWWGLLPQSDTSGSMAAASFSDHPSSDMTVGCTVRLKDGPKYGGGALVFRHHPQYGPQIARTLDQVEQAPLDHTSMMVKVLQQRRRGMGQMGGDHDVGGRAGCEGGLVGHYVDKWEGSQVTLLEDSTPVLGKLVAIDSGQAVIDISLKDEAGPISSSSSGSMSSLKIYRVSQLQVVSPASSPPSSSQGAETVASPRKAAPVSQGGRPTIRLAACKQQAAGVVQKQPVCIINAQQDASSESLFDISAPGASTSESLIAGFKPLSAIFIDEKPLILVQRLCDKKVFLLLSSKSSGTILQPSSFIAVGTGKSQPLKCTVEEESVSSTDAGFSGHSLEDIMTFYPSEIDLVAKGTSTKGKHSQKKVGQKRRHVESTTEELESLLLEHVKTPELCSNSTGSVLLLRDLAGGVYALKNGLALSHCVSSGDRSDADGYGLADTAFSALSIEERTLDSSTSCILFVLVPKPDSLLEDVIAGRVEQVMSAISQIQNSVLPKNGHKGKERQGTSAAKRRKACTAEEDLSYGDGMLFRGAVESSEMKLPITCEPLLACATRNRNILHLCCEVESSTVTVQRNNADSLKDGRDSRSAGASSGGESPHLVILKALLNSSCAVISTVVKYLLCQKNSSGYNPFQWALRLQNHSAALAILDYVNCGRSTVEPGVDSAPPTSTTNRPPSSLFDRTILQHSGEGMTPLQLFVRSLLPSSLSYDLCSKVMKVFNLPSGVTAQQLYELFHSYYPSVYRVEVKDGDKEEGENIDSGDTSDSEDEDKNKDGSGERRGAGLSGGPSSSSSANPSRFPSIPSRHINRRPRTRRDRRILRGRYRIAGDPDEPLMALVYFSDVQHLRSAASQMQNHRLYVSRNRNLAWSSGQSFRCIEIEVDAYQDPDSHLPSSADGSGIFGMMDWGRLHSRRRPKLADHDADEGSRVRSSTTIHCSEASAHLLKKLLEDVEIAAMTDVAGETAVSSLLHNRAALQTLLTPSNSKELHAEQKDKQRSIPHPSAFQSGRDQMQRDAMNRTLFSQARDVHRQSLRHIREMEDYLHSMAQQLGLRTLPPRLASLASRPTQAKPTTLILETVTLSPSADVSDAPAMSSPSSSLQLGSPQGGISRTPSKPSPLTTSVTAAPQPPTSSGGDEDAEMTSAPDCERDNLYDHVVLDTRKESTQSSAEPLGISTPVQAEEDQQMEPSHSNLLISGSSSRLEVNDSISLVKRVFSSWPCIVSTVLGYTPNCMHSATSSSKLRGGSELNGDSHMKAGHVTVLDAFLQKLLYSAHTQLINTFFTTVIEKITYDLEQENAARYFQKEDGSYSFDKIPLEEGSVGLVVGGVLLRAVIRLLTVEYSKPMGASTTTLHRVTPTESSGHADEEDLDHHPSQGRRQQQPLRNTNTQEKSQNVYPVIKSILTAFSCISLEFLASACEGVMAPVRLGLAKPLGASSVCAEYQMSSSRTTSVYGGGRLLDHSASDAQSTLPSSSLPHLRASSSYRARDGPLFTLPTGGIRLQPQSGLTEAQNYSQDALDNDVGEDIWPAASQNAEEGVSFSTPMTQDSDNRVPVSFSLNDWDCLIDEEMMIVETSDSDSEAEAIQLQDILHAGHNIGGGGVEEENGGMVYQYAWALDGRTLGEVFRGTSSTPMELIDPYVDPKSLSVNNIPSIRFGAGFLTRTFARLLKELVDIAKDVADRQKGVQDKEKEVGSKGIKIPMVRLPESVFAHVLQSSLSTLEPSWDWVVSLMDVAEGQLQRGTQFDTQHYVQALRGTSRNSSHLPHSPHAGMSAAQGSRLIGSSPAEYVTSLLRSHTGESEGTLPVLDLYGYEHVVYALDGFMYVLSNWPKDAQATLSSASCPEAKEKTALGEPSLHNRPSEQEAGSSMEAAKDHHTTLQSSPTDKSYSAFFKRSVSLFESSPPDLSLDDSISIAPESVFSRSVTEELPLAEHPHLLSLQAKQSSVGHSSTVGKASSSASSSRANMPVSLHAGSALPKPSLVKWTPEQAAQHWQTTISVFAHIFLVEGPGNERSNFLYTHAGVASRMARFRHQVNVLRDQSSGQREFGFNNGTLSIRVRRTHLLQDGLELLKNLTSFRYSQVRVRFDGEDGSGPGVNRGFFAAFANALKASDKLKGGSLLHEPGKLPEQAGLFAPTSLEYSNPVGMSKKDKDDRLFNFRALGRFIGLCLWFKQTVPLMISRHVAKFLLGRELTWHDLAFFNSDLYEGLRRMLLDAEEGAMSKEDFLAAYCCYFEAPLGDSMVELVPGGTKIPVSPDRVKEYVKLYAMFRMVECVKSELKSMKHGLYNVIPVELLSGITAEDFQLLLSGGSENITLSMLKSCFRFQHSHSGSKNITQRFERMFWKVVSQMTTQQKQQLLYFATGSSALPLQADGGTSFQVVIDVIGGNLESLPIASTCSQRVSIPLYPSYHILRRKLLQAIQCQSYGLA